jgi:CheY-like chemotaxis protein
MTCPARRHRETLLAPPVALFQLKGTDLLAGRKLLLADDSVTIQKVIDLTFADEGVEVITCGDGTDAIEKVEQLLPDIVLADVHMPGFTGYEVCEYIKGSEKLKHIPVMLLVGSFEPFDEVEARRVGANDTLTKPFQSIRRLLEKVGVLVGGKAPETEVDTAELPKSEQAEAPQLSTAEIEMTTADTRQLPPEVAHQAPDLWEASAMSPAPVVAPEPAPVNGARPSLHREEPVEVGNEPQVESKPVEVKSAMVNEQADTPLDLEYYEPEQALEADDFELELELELDEPEAAPEPAFAAPGYYQPKVVAEPVREAVVGAVVESRGPLTANNVSPELIDAIARRAVEMLSEKVVREIAWEVVPELAELLIKRQLEEREKQHR